MFGHNIDVNALTGENLPSEVKRRWSRSWYLDMDDVNANGGTVSFHFNYAASGLISPIGVHALIYRSTRNDAFEVLQTKLVLAGDETVFVVDISTLSDGYYTLGFIFENDEYVMDIAGIGKDAEGTRSIAESAGLTVENISFLQNNGDFMRFGHKTTVNEIVVSDLPQSIEARWSRSWFIDFTDENTQGGDLKFTFNYSNGNFPETPTGVHALIKRSNESSSFEIVATQLILSGTETAFTVNVNDLGDGFYTLGLVKNFAAENGDHVLDFTGIYRIDPFLITANQSAGLIIENKSYLYDNWDYVVWGHNTPEITLYNKNLPPSIGYRWNRDWFIHFDDTNANGGDITIKFDFMGVGFGEPFDAEYFLIHRDQPNDTFEKIDAIPVVTDRSVDFVCDVSDLTDGYYCIGMNLLLEIEDLTGTPAGLPVSETANQLALWLKPEKLTRQSAGTPTQIWADASVHENNLTQEIKTSQPLYTPNVINGQPALYFDGTNDYMDTLNDALTARTVFAVLKIDEDAPYLSCLLTETDTDENNIRTNVPVSVWRATQHYADLNDFSYKGFAAVNGADTDMHDNQYHVLTQMSASQKDFHLRISQVLQARYFKGYLSELVIFENPLNKAQRRIMENYLSAKYNISIVGDRYQGDDIHFGNYDLEVSGIGKDYDGHSTTGQSGGLIIQDIDFLHPFHWLSLLQISI
jgi:azurin